MLRFLWNLIFGCNHDYEVHRGHAARFYGGFQYHEHPKIIFTCRKCGKIKEVWG